MNGNVKGNLQQRADGRCESVQTAFAARPGALMLKRQGPVGVSVAGR
nr:hypothetical protein [uncultured Anaeromusa sp.]